MSSNSGGRRQILRVVQMRNYTFGSELELGNIDTRLGPPPRCHFTGDPDVCNMNPHAAADPEKKDYHLGSEVNTDAHDSISSIMDTINGVFHHYRSSPPVVNHRCVLHLHIGYKDLPNNLEDLKKILSYTNDNGMWYINNHWKYTIPSDVDSHTRKFLSFDCITMQNWKYQFCMNATTTDDFRRSHAKVKDGRVIFPTMRRYCVNMYPIFKHAAIEFRWFFPTTDLTQIESAFQFITRYMDQALGDRIPVSEWVGKYNLPKEVPFDHKLEKAWRLTNYKFNSRKIANSNREKIINGEIQL